MALIRNIGLATVLRAAGAALTLSVPHAAEAANCYDSTIVSPSPFMGNNDEVFKLSDGSIWQVKYEYEYLYEYLPDVVICPSSGMLVVDGKSLNVVELRAPSSAGEHSGLPANSIVIVYRRKGCDYFVANGPTGYYVLEWFGGHDPDVGDVIVGYETGYGMKDVTYLQSGSTGRIWVEDYLLSRDSAAKKIADKCR